MTKDDLGRITGGSITVPGLEQGATYVFESTFDGQKETRTINITGPNMTLDVSNDLSDYMCAS